MRGGGAGGGEEGEEFDSIFFPTLVRHACGRVCMCAMLRCRLWTPTFLLRSRAPPGFIEGKAQGSDGDVVGWVHADVRVPRDLERRAAPRGAEAGGRER